MKLKIKQWLKYKIFKAKYIKCVKACNGIEVKKLKPGLYELKHDNVKIIISNKDIKKLLKIGMTPLDASYLTIKKTTFCA